MSTIARERPVTATPYVSPHLVPIPVRGTRITEPYARMVAREAYFWAWPMVNMYNRRLAFQQVPERGLMNGVLPICLLYTSPSPRDS